MGTIKFSIGQIIYHVTDEMQEPRLITGIIHRPNNVITYMIGFKDGENECYDVELSNEKIIF